VHARKSSARKHLTAVLAACATAASIAGLPPLPVGAVQVAHPVVVSADPADWTPNITDPPHLNWHVESIAKVGSRIIVAGKFNHVQNAAGGTVFDVTGLFAFDATTGLIDDTGFGFPVVTGRIDSLSAAEDGTSVFVAGDFGTIDGANTRKIAKLDVATGQVITAFKASANDKVNDIVARGDKVYMGGAFTTVRGIPRSGLAAINATTGAVDPQLAIPVSQSRLAGTPVHVDSIDVTPDGSRLLLAGNFNQIGGFDRKQIGQINLTTSPDVVANWQTDRFGPNCAFPKFETYIRDVDYSPDGSYFVTTTTGATAINFGGGHLKGPLCDATARFETFATGTGINATWANFTGGDTNYSVAATNAAVYVGGHQRWQNNYFGRDAAKAGAVSRPGIAALSTLNGMPLSWNPTRVRGLGAQALLATAEGLWVGSDTDTIGREFHQKIALMPVIGGSTEPPAQPGVLPGRLYTIEQDGSLVGRSFNPATGTFGSATQPTTLDWSTVRGAFMLSGTLYTGWDEDPLVNGDNGTLRSQTVDLATVVVGPQAILDLHGLDLDLVADRHPQPPHMGIQLEDMTGAFWDPAKGRLYYTVAGDPNLYHRYFLPESRLLGDVRFTTCTWSSPVSTSTCGAFNPGAARGMTLASGKFYYSGPAGNLWTMGFNSATGRPTGTPTQVSGPLLDGNDWNSKGLFAGA
jgi:hypothetical protein